MVLPDVNIYVYAFRPDTERHAEARLLLEETINGPSDFGFSDLAGSGFVRIVTSPKIFNRPDTVENALSFLEIIVNRPNCIRIRPGERHWEIFSSLLRESGARGNLVPDAYFAALAIVHGCEWITADRDYSRFPGLRTAFF